MHLSTRIAGVLSARPMFWLVAFFVWSTPGWAKIYLQSTGDLRVYAVGVAELDIIHDSTRSYTEVTGNGPIAPAATADGANGRLQFSVRDSRLGLGLETDRPGGLQARSYIEFDLAGYAPAPGASNSEADFYHSGTVRLRLAYFQVDSAGWQLLAGEYWSLFGWQQDYVPSTVAVRPSTGAAYERVPQLLLSRSVGDTTGWNARIAAALSRPVQRDSGVPSMETGLRVAFGGLLAPYTATATGDVKPAGASLGLSTTTRQLAHSSDPTGVTRTTHTVASAVAVDLRLPLLGVRPGEPLGSTLVAVGEWTRGRGYGDQFSGWSGNVRVPVTSPPLDAGLAGVDPRGDFTPLELESWTATVQYHAPVAWRAWATLGFGDLASNNAGNLLPAAGKTIYTHVQELFANAVHNLTPEIRAGVEASWNRVRYTGETRGVDTRVQLSTWYRF